jgi:3-oxoacyl-[acyl-carrier-protein] synthase-3
MLSSQAVGILGCGSFLPAEEVTNASVAAAAGVTPEWIEERTGIRARRRAHPAQAASDLALAAARDALAAAGIAPGRLSVIVVATSTPDSPQPPTANLVQHGLGARDACAFDLNAVCSGFVYALDVARRMVADGGLALVAGVDVYSRILDPCDRRTAVLFGDGAGAVVLGPVAAGRGIETVRLASFGEHHAMIRVPAGGSRIPASEQSLRDGGHWFAMDGRAVRDFVERELPPAVRQFLADRRVAEDEIRHFVPHQANGRLVDELAARLALPVARTHTTVRDLGNTGAASVPVTLAAAQDHFAYGDLMLLAAFGGGMSTGLALLRW